MPDTRSTASSGGDREVGVHRAGEAGLVDEHDELGLRDAGRDVLHEGVGPAGHRRARHAEGQLGGDAGRVQGDTEGDRPGDRDLDRSPAVGHGGQEGAEADETVRREPGIGERRLGVERVERRRRSSRRRAGGRRARPTRPGRSCPPRATAPAATVPPAGRAGGAARSRPRRSGRSAGGCRWTSRARRATARLDRLARKVPHWICSRTDRSAELWNSHARRGYANLRR